MEEYMSLTHSSCGHFSITYDKYFMMLQNACIRCDKTLQQKLCTTLRAVHDEEDNYMDHNFAQDGIDTPSDDTYNIHNTNFNRAPQVKSHIPRPPPGKPKSAKLYLPNLGTMDLAFPSISTTCLVMMSRRN